MEILILFIIIVVVVAVLLGGDNSSNDGVSKDDEYGTNSDAPEMTEEEVVNAVKQIDPDFSKEEFLSMAKDVFIKLQYAWSDKDLDTIRCLETSQLFEIHKSQIERFTNNNQTEKIERLSISWAKLFGFIEDGSREVLSVLINSSMIDYLIDNNKGKIINGSNKDLKTNTYKLTFVRTAGTKTSVNLNAVNVKNCPNCGAPVEITSTGKCSYCGTVLTTNEFSWVLSNLEPYEAKNGSTDYGKNSGGYGLGFVTGAAVTGIVGGVARRATRPRRGMMGPQPRPQPRPQQRPQQRPPMGRSGMGSRPMGGMGGRPMGGGPRR